MKRPTTPAAPRTSTAPKVVAAEPTSPVDRDTIQSKAQQLAQKLADERRHAAWLNGFRFSAFSLVMAGVLVVGVLSLIPRIQELVTQRQQIAALEADIAATKADITAKEAERQQWNDETFIETQARERLYFVQPGDVSYLVINDLTAAQLTQPAAATATTTVEQTQGSWLGTLLGSVWSAGNSPVSTEPVATDPAVTEPAQ